MAIQGGGRALSDAERSMVLDRIIAERTSQGWRVVSRSEFSVQLLKPKQFSCALATLSFLFFGIGFLVYIFIYMALRDTLAYCSVDEYGQVNWSSDQPM